jgi:hypothetical protein
LGVLLSLVSCLSLFIADAALAAEDEPVQLWWNFVVDIDARYSNGHKAQGKGVILGRFNVGLFDLRHKNLLIVTANHVVRSRDGQGQPASSITVRLPWSATQARLALLTGLVDSGRDVAVLSLPLDPSDEPFFRFLVVSCPAELKAGSGVRVGDLTAGALALGGGHNTGSFAGEDDRGNLLVSGLSVIEGQSGSPLINADGAVVAIQTSAEGRTGVAVGVPIERLEKMFPDGDTYLDGRLQPISKADGKARRETYADQRGCAIGKTACVVTCEHCDLVKPQPCPKCEDCNKQSSECSQVPAAPVDDPWSLEWYLVPTCRCIDSRIAALGQDKTDYGLRCTELGLMEPLQTELRGDFREIPSRLAKRFPATESDFETYVVEQPRGSAWRLYRKAIEDAETEAKRDSDDVSLEKIAISSANSMVLGPPHCHRIPASFRAEAARGLEGWLEENDAVRITEVRGGIAWCGASVRIGIEEEKLLLLQIGGKWIFFPGDFSTW